MDGSDRVRAYSVKIKSSVMRQFAVTLCMGVVLCSLSYLISRSLSVSAERFLLGLCWISVASSFVFIKTGELRCSKLSKLIVIVGYIFRLIIAFWGTYGTGTIISFLNYGDQENFFNIARQYYEGNFDPYRTRYPYILLWIFKIAGLNRMMPQLFNIMCWYLGILILGKMAKGFYKKSELILLCFYTYMPWTLLISTQLYREPIMNLLMMLVYYFGWKWMNNGRLVNMIIAGMIVLPLFLLHSGNIVMLPILFILYVHWSWKEQRWRRVSSKGVLYCALLLALPGLMEMISGGYFPTTFSLESLTNYAYSPGRTDYIPEGISVNTWFPFFLWTVYRMVYFWISPSPRLWNSMLDIVCFLMDVVPWSVLIVWMLYENRRQKNPQARVGMLFVLLYTFVYGWGTRNAGTAMRHRGQLLGIVVMAILIGCKAVLGEKKTCLDIKNGGIMLRPYTEGK